MAPQPSSRNKGAFYSKVYKTEGFSAIVPFLNKVYKYGDALANVYLHLALCILYIA
jgi:hypothetical protein